MPFFSRVLVEPFAVGCESKMAGAFCVVEDDMIGNSLEKLHCKKVNGRNRTFDFPVTTAAASVNWGRKEPAVAWKQKPTDFASYAILDS